MSLLGSRSMFYRLGVLEFNVTLTSGIPLFSEGIEDGVVPEPSSFIGWDPMCESG